MKERSKKKSKGDEKFNKYIYKVNQKKKEMCACVCETDGKRERKERASVQKKDKNVIWNMCSRIKGKKRKIFFSA